MFRGMTKEGKWVEGWLCIWQGIVYIFRVPWELYHKGKYEVTPESIGMDTGLKDKNDKPIFGSILINGKMTKGGNEIIYSTSQTQHRRGYVYYEPCQWLIDVRWQKNDPLGEVSKGFEMEHSKGVVVGRLSDDLYNLEVIGPALEEK